MKYFLREGIETVYSIEYNYNSKEYRQGEIFYKLDILKRVNNQDREV